MLRILKKLFRKEPQRPVEIGIAELQQWVEKQVSALELNQYLQEYFRKIAEIKSRLQDDAALLSQQEISKKEKQQVEGRIQNIVVGHKNHYVQEMQRFVDALYATINNNPATLSDYHQALAFNQELREKLDHLAQRTAKSYQAAQHLFFDNVEKIFNSLGELNLLVKSFRREQIQKIDNLRTLLASIDEGLDKQRSIQERREKKEEMLKILFGQKEKLMAEVQKLRESKEYYEYENARQKEQELRQEKNAVENDIHSFFARLKKPLKKYEHLAPENKPLLPYLEESIAALRNDGSLKIMEVLQGLKKTLAEGTLEFDEKQKNNFLQLIEKSEQGYLQELQEKDRPLQKKLAAIRKELSEQKIVDMIKKAEGEAELVGRSIKDVEKEISRFKTDDTGLEKSKGEFCRAVQDVLKVEVRISDEGIRNGRLCPDAL